MKPREERICPDFHSLSHRPTVFLLMLWLWSNHSRAYVSAGLGDVCDGAGLFLEEVLRQSTEQVG